MFLLLDKSGALWEAVKKGKSVTLVSYGYVQTGTKQGMKL